MPKITAVNGSEPLTLADFIQQAKDATEEANLLQSEADSAKAKARAAFDSVYEALVQLKRDAKDMDTFRTSKLGKLLQGVNEAAK